jgi:hypothetical protein
MFNKDNSATVFFPSQLHWTSEQLAEAVPLRLHQLFAFDASGVLGSANAPLTRALQARSRDFLPLMPDANVFRVR